MKLFKLLILYHGLPVTLSCDFSQYHLHQTSIMISWSESYAPTNPRIFCISSVCWSLQVLNYPHKYFVEISASEMTDNKPLEKGSTTWFYLVMISALISITTANISSCEPALVQHKLCKRRLIQKVDKFQQTKANSNGTVFNLNWLFNTFYFQRYSLTVLELALAMA